MNAMSWIKFLLLLLLFQPIFLFGAEIQIANLKVEYTETPLGIDVARPRFSWQMHVPGNERGYRQTAYQLVITDETGDIVWDSYKIKSDISLNIEYSGRPLLATTRYNWKVSVWDQNNNKYTGISWFEIGLMNPRISAWNDAKWIGGGDDDVVLYSAYLPVFKINYSVQLDEKTKSTRAGFIYGANDNRLMDKYKNLYYLESKKDSSYLLIEIDITPLASNENARLNIFRIGYHPEDKEDIPYKSFPISTEIINENNKYAEHFVNFSSVLGYTRIYISEEKIENLIGEINLNPMGQGGDFIAFPMLGDIGFAVSKGQQAYFSNIEIRNYRSPSNILFAEDLNDASDYNGIFSKKKGVEIEGSSYKVTAEHNNVFVTADPSRNAMPMLRTTFSADKGEISKARLYITSRGIYDVYINGERVGDDYFNPGLTQYTKTHLYQTFDVTEQIHSGKNTIGVILSEGWWSGGATYTGDNWNFFGDRQSLLAKLVITYPDGTEDVIVTNPSTWKYFNNGPVTYSSFFQGEVYDAAKEKLVTGWSMTTFNDASWKNCVEVSLEGTININKVPASSTTPAVNDYSAMNLIGQFGETVKKIKELTAISMEEIRPGIFIYDMGQNMAGVPEIQLTNMEPGQKILLRFAEVKYPDLPEYKEHTGMIMLENIRAAMAQDIYITKGGNESIRPRFTFHGYRFVEITGIEEPLPLSSVKAQVLSSIYELASKYKTSDPKINKLWENITWSTYSNFLSIPTDCPQRNERLGWSGDISVFSRTATYLANTAQFLRRHMLAMRDTQREDGRFPDIAPLGGGFGGILWGSAGITVAWESYQQYNDKALLSEHYDAMKDYMEYLQRHIDPETNIIKNSYRSNWGSLGDWLSPEHDKNEKSLLWEAYFLYDLELMSRIASELAKPEDAALFKELHQERKVFFNKTYIDKETGKTKFPDSDRIVDSQVSYVLPLAFNLVEEHYKEKFTANFLHTIQRESRADNGTVCPPYSLMTGFIGTSWISKVLSDCGYTDVAYRLLQQTEYPSWLYSVEQGATTIWERLNSYTHKDGFGGNNQMNSFNHYSFGAVAAWMYNYSLGIERDENSPGFKHFILKPEPDPTGKMTSAEGYYDSMYGRIESGWKKEGNNYLYRFVIPANTSATLYLEASSVDDIVENGKPLRSSKNTNYLGLQKGKYAFELQSGEYNILTLEGSSIFK